MEDFIFREGSIADLHQLKKLGLVSYAQFAESLSSENWEQMRDFLNNEEQLTQLIKKSKCYVTLHKNRIIGMAYLISSGNPTDIYKAEWCYIRMVGVDPDYRGHGIAKALTKMCINHALSTNEKTVALHTSEMMPAARHIYESLGFSILNEIDPRYDKRYWLYTLDLDKKLKYK